MTSTAALHQFFNGFMTAYPAHAVPDDVTFPYLTYTPIVGVWQDTATITVNIWSYGASEAEPNALASQLADLIGMGGKLITCDDGAIWLKRGAPWCQSLSDSIDHSIKRRYINVTAEFLTTN